MTKFKDYNSSGEILGEREEPISAVNFERAGKEHGQQYIAGYLDAMRDILQEAKSVAYKGEIEDQWEDTAANTRTKLRKYLAHKTEILTILTKIQIEKNNKTPVV